METMAMENEEQREQMRSMIREEFSPVIERAVQAAVTDAIKKFTRDFYADIGKGVIYRLLLPVLGTLMVYWAHRLGLISIFDGK